VTGLGAWCGPADSAPVVDTVGLARRAAGQGQPGAWHPTLTYLVLLVIGELALAAVLSKAIGWQWI
jgi:hypothetical protein